MRIHLFTQSRIAVIATVLIAIYFVLAIFSWTGLSMFDYASSIGPSYETPSYKFWFGTDLLGRDVFAKVIHGIGIALAVGAVASLIAIPLGAVLGAVGGYFGGKLDDGIVWLYSTVASVPQILLLTAVSFILGRGLVAVYLAVGLTSWVGICRVIRGEVIKLKEREFVVAARALGGSDARILFKHILPNVTHLLIVDFSLRFIYAIKSEAILSYLGIGVQGEPSWGTMIADSKEELIQGIWWQLTTTTVAMFLIVLALNLVGDALRDVLDPRVSGEELPRTAP